MSHPYIGTPCPYCWIPLTQNDTIAVCDSCGKPHHVSCWRTSQGCTTIGCSGRIGQLLQPDTEPVGSGPRFRLVADFPELRVQPDAPVAICGILLLEDSREGKLLAKCTFQSFTNRSLRALWVNLICRDQNGRTLPDAVTFRYQDLRAQRGSEFGGDIPIELPDPRTRFVDVQILNVIYTDGSGQTCTDMTRIYPEPKALGDHLGRQELVQEFIRRTTPQARLAPFRTPECWMCTCGSINGPQEQDCPRCGCSLSQVMAAADPAGLAAAVPPPAVPTAPEPPKAKPAPKAAGKGRLKYILIGGAAVLAIITCLVIFLGYPAYCYEQGRAALENGDYSAAHDYFLKAGSYKNSEEMTSYVYYEEGCRYLKEGRYPEAIGIFEQIPGYMNSNELCAEAYALHADSLMQETDFSAAFQAIDQNPDPSRAREQKIQCVQDWAAALLDPANDAVTAADIDDFLTLIGTGEYSDVLYNAVLDQMAAHPDYESYWKVNPAAAEAAGALLSRIDPYENSISLGQVFVHMHASYEARQAHFAENRSIYEQMWNYELIRDYVNQEGVMELFLLGTWETVGGQDDLTFQRREQGKPGCHYSLPNVRPSSSTVDYTIAAGEFLWIDAQGAETGRLFRITLLSPTEIQVYCYGNGATYTLYRTGNG